VVSKNGSILTISERATVGGDTRAFSRGVTIAGYRNR